MVIKWILLRQRMFPGQQNQASITHQRCQVIDVTGFMTSPRQCVHSIHFEFVFNTHPKPTQLADISYFSIEMCFGGALFSCENLRDQ